MSSVTTAATGDASKPRVYPSRVDLWLLVVLVLVPVSLFGMGCFKLQESVRVGGFLLLQGMLVTGLIVVLTVPCRYVLSGQDLIVRCGVITSTIRLSAIERIEPSSSWRSAPALSLRRVKLTHGENETLISPRDRERFTVELSAAVAKARSAAAAGA